MYFEFSLFSGRAARREKGAVFGFHGYGVL